MKTLALLCSLAALATGVAGCKKPDDGSANKKSAEGSARSAEGSAKSPPSESIEIAISCGSVGKDFDTCKEGSEAWAKKTGHKVKVVTSPTSSSEKLAVAQQLLAAGASDIDVFSVDVVWPGILGSFFLDLKQYSKGAENEHFPALVANGTIDGKLIAMPWYVDAGLLYYRKDLLEKYKEEVPTTWAQLTATAKKIQDAERKAGNKDMQGFVFQGKAYEGLTCNALEWIASYGGGMIVDPDGKITIDNPKAVAALELAGSWPGTISPVGVLNFEEPEAHGVFQASGNAVFMRNWPYAWALVQDAKSPVKDKVGVAALPKGEGDGARPAATLGGWDLSVSKFSAHPAEAADLVLYLTAAAEQKRRAITAGFHPTIPSLYGDKDILAANPFFASLADVFKSAVPRPSVTAGKYNQVSSAFWNAVHAVLAKEKPAKDAVSELSGKLEQIKGAKW